MIILIDNDKIIHLGWKMRAVKSGTTFLSFYSVEEFLKENISPEAIATVYIDSDLENSLKGEVEAKLLYQKGYRNLFLSTGYSGIDVKDYPWLKGVITKTPPF